MLNWRGQKHKTLWLFLPAAILASLAASYLTINYALPSGGIRSAIAKTQNLQAEADDIVVLPKGDAQTVGRVMMTYRGLITGRIIINITPAKNESGYAYRRDIPINTAEKGFWLARQYYKLVSAGRSKLEIIRIRL